MDLRRTPGSDCGAKQSYCDQILVHLFPGGIVVVVVGTVVVVVVETVVVATRRCRETSCPDDGSKLPCAIPPVFLARHNMPKMA